MGTQSSYGGPRDKTPLLPDWALQTPSPPDDTDDQGTDQDGPASDDGNDGTNPTTPAPAVPTKAPGLWRAANGRLGSCTRGGNRTESIRKAARSYVKALGGSRRAARSSAAGRNATASLGSFLTGIASNGLDATLRTFHLAAYVGKDAETVFAAVINAICPEGASREDVAARESVSDALWQLYGKLIPEDGNLTALNSLTDEQVQTTLITSIATYIYRRWLGDLGIKIEQKAISANDAVKLERQMKTYIRDSVKLELGGRTALTVDWKAKEGRELVESIYRDAFNLIGGQS
jgi:hypothetical protein